MQEAVVGVCCGWWRELVEVGVGQPRSWDAAK